MSEAKELAVEYAALLAKCIPARHANWLANWRQLCECQIDHYETTEGSGATWVIKNVPWYEWDYWGNVVTPHPQDDELSQWNWYHPVVKPTGSPGVSVGSITPTLGDRRVQIDAAFEEFNQLLAKPEELLQLLTDKFWTLLHGDCDVIGVGFHSAD